MSEEPFIARWSRRKRGIADPKAEPEAPPRTESADTERRGDARADERKPPVREPEEPDYGGWLYQCLDPEGHLWSFGSYDPWAEA